MTNEGQNNAGPTTSQAGKTADPRARIIDALMRLAAERAFEDIAIRDICAAADVTLADFRDAFPSKGAVLGGFSKRIDRAVLSHGAAELASEAPRERLFDVLMRRLDAMAPYRDGFRGIAAWLRRDPAAALAMNRESVNSMRFMLEAAGIDSDGAAGALKLQGLAFAWARVLAIWLEDSEPGLSRTMAALDRELTHGARWVAGVDQLQRMAAPLKSIARAAMESRSRARERFRRPGEAEPTDDASSI